MLTKTKKPSRSNLIRLGWVPDRWFEAAHVKVL
jgi:hypothetical protein